MHECLRQAEIFRLQDILYSTAAGPIDAESIEPSHATELNGYLIMLRPLSAKWKPTWCVLRGHDIEFYGTERERVREVRTTAHDIQVTKKATGKAVLAGKIALVPGVKCEWVPEGSNIE